MQDFLIVFGGILGLLFWFWGTAKRNWGLLAITSVLFLIIGGIGILGSGWETYDNNTFLFNYDGSGDLNKVYNPTTTLEATVEDNPVLWATGWVTVILSLTLSIQAFRIRKTNKEILDAE